MEVKTIWLTVLAERLCHQLSFGNTPSRELATLVLSTAARLLPTQRYFDMPLAPADWLELRAQLLEAHPGATHSLDGATSEQVRAEAALKTAAIAGVDLYFGSRQRTPAVA